MADPKQSPSAPPPSGNLPPYPVGLPPPGSFPPGSFPFPPPGFPPGAPPGFPPPPPGFVPPPGFAFPPPGFPPPSFPGGPPLPPGSLPPGFPPFSHLPAIKKDMLCVFIPKSQNWYFLLDNMSWNTNPSRQFYLNMGNKDDIPCPGNFAGDGLRVATWRKGKFYIKGTGKYDYGATQGNSEVLLGKEGDIPVPNDFFGDGVTRMAVFRASDGKWLIKGPGLHDWVNTTDGNISVQCGQKGDIPCAGDFFGEGKPRLAVFRPKDGKWHIKGLGLTDWNSSKDNISLQSGCEGDIPVPADYFGEGKDRIATFRPAKEASWFIKGPGFANWEGTPGNVDVKFGQKGDIPCPGDFFGEGKVRMAVYRPSAGNFHIKGPDFESGDKSKGNLVITLPEAHGIPVVRKWDFK